MGYIKKVKNNTDNDYRGSGLTSFFIKGIFDKSLKLQN